MNETIETFLDSLSFGDIQTFNNLSFIPIFQRNGKSLSYISLVSAIKKNYVEVKEINSSGSVPDLLLINNSDKRVFIIHGEELIGAKQNRTVNTSLLINKKTSVTIPVSCVERGRWNFVSDKFMSSDFMIPAELKKKAMYSASHSLRRGLGARADQSEVWDEIDQMSAKAKVVSRTSSLHDVNKTYEKDFEKIISNFKLITEQKGIVAFVNGKIQGIEFTSRHPVFKKYYTRILKSFAFNAIQSDEEKSEISQELCQSQLKEKLDFVRSYEWSRFKSVGLGFDYRLESEKSVGSILSVDKYIVSFNNYFEN